jgi:hypothetical protein
MSEAMSDVMSNLRDKAPTLPSAKDATDAVLSHLPMKRSPKTRSKWAFGAVVIGAIATAAAAFGISRRRSGSANDASIYTPPLPKP